MRESDKFNKLLLCIFLAFLTRTCYFSVFQSLCAKLSSLKTRKPIESNRSSPQLTHPQALLPLILLNRLKLIFLFSLLSPPSQCLLHRWFYHFYLLASIFYSILLLSIMQVYFRKQQVPGAIQVLLDSLVGQDRKASGKAINTHNNTLESLTSGLIILAIICLSIVTPESVLIAMVLILAQVGRRLTECTFLSVYSNAKMNIIHYIFGHSFYLGVGLSIIAEAPGFAGK